MILQQELLQKMADRIIDDIGYNINIIDKDGIIVASGSKERIGDFHAIGHEAAKSEQRIDINSETVHLYTGVKEGINQPFYYRGQLAGVIGITGQSDEINDFVKVVKTMIEVMVEQERLKERMFLRQNSKAQFINLLLNIRSNEDIVTLNQWARQLDYNFNTSRAAIIVTIKDQIPLDLTALLKWIKKIKTHQKKDFSSILSNDKILILKYVDPGQSDDDLRAYADDLIQNLGDYGLSNIKIGIGSIYNTIDTLSSSYDEAAFCIDLIQETDQTISFIDDHLYHYFLKQLPEDFYLHYIQAYYKKIAHSDELMDTLVALTKNHMNLVETSKAMFIHRNTVVFRLNKLKELTGLDPIHIRKDRNIFELMAYYRELFALREKKGD